MASFQLSEGLWTREESKCLDVAWPYDIEMPVVEGGDLGDPQAFCYSDHGGIDNAERKMTSACGPTRD